MSGRLLALAGTWIVGVLLAAGALVLVVESDHTDDKAATAALALTAGLSFITSGLVAIWRRPENRTGLLMTATGFLWLLGALTTANNGWVFTIGFLVGGLAWGPFAHLILAFPTGRLERRFYRVFVGLTYALVIGDAVALALVDGTDEVCGADCPDSTIAIWPSGPAATVIGVMATFGATVIVLTALVILALRWRAATPAMRRTLGGVLFTAGTTLVLLLVTPLVEVFSERRRRWSSSRPSEPSAPSRSHSCSACCARDSRARRRETCCSTSPTARRSATRSRGPSTTPRSRSATGSRPRSGT